MSYLCMSPWLSPLRLPSLVLMDGAGALVGLSLALAAVFGVLLLRRYEVRSPVYRKAASSGNARAGGKVLLFASPACRSLASSYDQPSAAVETYLLLAGIDYEKRLGNARTAPRGSVRGFLSGLICPVCIATVMSAIEAATALSTQPFRAVPASVHRTRRVRGA